MPAATIDATAGPNVFTVDWIAVAVALCLGGKYVAIHFHDAPGKLPSPTPNKQRHTSIMG